MPSVGITIDTTLRRASYILLLLLLLLPLLPLLLLPRNIPALAHNQAQMPSLVSKDGGVSRVPARCHARADDDDVPWPRRASYLRNSTQFSSTTFIIWSKPFKMPRTAPRDIAQIT
jgi:hypothetical protein